MFHRPGYIFTDKKNPERGIMSAILGVIACVCGMYFPAGDTGAPSHRQENRSVSHCCIGVVVCRDPAVRRLGDHQGTVGICADLRDVS